MNLSNAVQCEFILLGSGTSQGVPVLTCTCEVCTSNDSKDRRYRTSALLKVDRLNILIDIGPDFRAQFLENELETIDAILLTHEHSDHVAGLDEIRAINYLQHKRIPIYAEKRVIDDIKIRYKYIFAPSAYPGLPLIDLNEIKPFEPFKVEKVEIMPLTIMHGSLPIIGFRCGDLSYITDAKSIPRATRQIISDSKYLFLSALHHNIHHSHFNLDEALEFVKDLMIPNVYLLHISHMMGLYKTINSILPRGVQMAYDGLKITFSK